MGLAAPTQTLLSAAIYAQEPIRMTCFPYAIEIAEAVAGSVGAHVSSDKPGEVKRPHCVSFSYKTRRETFEMSSCTPGFEGCVRDAPGSVETATV